MAREGVVQGDPLAMFLYALGLLPLAEKLREESDGLAIPFYADDLPPGCSDKLLVDCRFFSAALEPLGAKNGAGGVFAIVGGGWWPRF